MSYNYFLCFQESKFWPCPCEVKLRDKDSSVWGKSAISTYTLKVGILPVCVWVSRGHPWSVSIQGTNQLFGHLHCLEIRAKEEQKGFEGFHTRTASKSRSAALSPAVTGELMERFNSAQLHKHRLALVLGYWSLPVGLRKPVLPLPCCLVRDAVLRSAQVLVAVAWKFVSFPRLWVNHWNSYKSPWNMKAARKKKGPLNIYTRLWISWFTVSE